MARVCGLCGAQDIGASASRISDLDVCTPAARELRHCRPARREREYEARPQCLRKAERRLGDVKQPESAYGRAAVRSSPVYAKKQREDRRPPTILTGLALFDRDPLLADFFALVIGARADQSIVAVLLENMCRPSRHAAHRKDRREQINGNPERVVSRRRVEID